MTVLERLLAATPLPPAGEIGELLECFAAMHRERQAILEGAGMIALDDDTRPLADELFRREDIWRAALAAAMATIRGQQRGVRQMRSYASGL